MWYSIYIDEAIDDYEHLGKFRTIYGILNSSFESMLC